MPGLDFIPHQFSTGKGPLREWPLSIQGTKRCGSVLTARFTAAVAWAKVLFALKVVDKTSSATRPSVSPMVQVGRDSDFIGIWENVMASIGHGLMIRFGLAHEPSAAKADEWARLTRDFIRQGFTQDAAGDQAAKLLFSDYRTRYYASQADTIALLLQQAGDKK